MLKVLTHLFTLTVISSSQAIRIRAAVAGESSLNAPVTPLSILAAVMASLIAKKTDEARNRGGSPTACMKEDENIHTAQRF
jgi:hypothetical protein